MWLLIPFILVPLIEIGLFIQVGGAIGLWSTLLIVVITAVIGTYLVRSQGIAVLRDLQNRVNAGQNPTEQIAHGAMILIAGVVLLTPGFFTDAVGFLLLLPPVRLYLIKQGAARIAASVHVQTGGGFSQGQPGQTRPDGNDDIIDGEFSPLQDSDPDPTPQIDPDAKPGSSGWTRRE